MGEGNWIYDIWYGVDRFSAVDGWVKSWMHWRGRCAVSRCEEMIYVCMSFIRCTEIELHALRLPSIVGVNSELADDAPVNHSLECVSFRHPYDTLHFLVNFNYWLKEIIFEHMFRVRTGKR